MLKLYLADDTTEVTGIKEIAYKECVNAESSIRSGSVTAAYIEVGLFAKQTNAIAAGTELHLFRDSTKIAVLYADPVIDDSNAYKLAAYDGIKKLDADFSQWLQANQSNFPMTAKALVSAACTVAGVTLGSSSWALSTQNVQAFYADGLTCRDILSYAAELGCKFVRCHADGKVYFDWYSASSNSIAPSAGTNQYAYKIGGLTYANYTTTALARVAVHPSGEDDVAYIYPANVTSGNTLHVKNNLLLTGASASFFNAAAQEIYNGVHGLGVYRPMTAELFPNESPFMAGDVISVTDNQNVSFTSIVTSMTASATSAIVESTGDKEYEEIPDTGKSLVQLASDIVRINKLKVSWAEIDQAIVNYLTANDVTAQNLTIVDANDNVLATFNANGIEIGRSSENRMLLDFNSFELLDRGGNAYAVLGDMRDANGEATLVEKTTTTSNISTLQTSFTISSIDRITVDGTPTSAYTYSGKTITFTNQIASGSSVSVKYKTQEAVYRYDLGKRKSGSNVGGYSVAGGAYSEASGGYSYVGGGLYNAATQDCSSVVGGRSNKANGAYSCVLGGMQNTASKTSSSVCGGLQNTASGASASVLGGDSNEASALYSSVAGGKENTASGSYSSVVGGLHNEASGLASVVIGGQRNQAIGHDQVVFGTFNDPQVNYVEIVGNGTSSNNRSNARTLDWNGNETLAGNLTLAGGTIQGGIYISNANRFPEAGTLAVYRYDGSTLNTVFTEGTSGWATGVIFAFSTSANNCSQLAITGGANVPYYRRCYGGTWTAWAKVYDTLSPPTASEVGAVDKTGDTMTGNLTFDGGWVIRNLPASMSSGTNYYVARFTNSDSTIRGGLAAYNGNNGNNGVRLVATQNGLNNGIGLYFDANDNPSVVLGQPAAWRDALGIVADYKAGDTISFPSTGNSYFTRFHGDWRDTKNLYFFIPTSRSCVGLSATVSGTIYLVTNGVRNSVSMSNVTPTCFCTDGGIAVRLQWSTAPSYAVQYNLASVQPYGFTVTFL